MFIIITNPRLEIVNFVIKEAFSREYFWKRKKFGRCLRGTYYLPNESIVNEYGVMPWTYHVWTDQVLKHKKN